eukprot:235687_1
MMYLFLSFIWIIAITTALTIDIMQFPCTQDSDCAELYTFMNTVAVNYLPTNSIPVVCSTSMGFCSVSCAHPKENICDALQVLKCNAASEICETDLTCVGRSDCRLPLTKCLKIQVTSGSNIRGICIPQQSAECDVTRDNIDGSNPDCTNPGFGKCKSTSIMGVALDICVAESCCPQGICDDAHCITQGTVCQELTRTCSYCTTDLQCDPFKLGLGLTCDTGKCSPLSP